MDSSTLNLLSNLIEIEILRLGDPLKPVTFYRIGFLLEASDGTLDSDVLV